MIDEPKRILDFGSSIINLKSQIRRRRLRYHFCGHTRVVITREQLARTIEQSCKEAMMAKGTSQHKEKKKPKKDPKKK